MLPLLVLASAVFGAEALGQSTEPAPVVKVIRFGKLVDGTGAVLTNAAVVVEGDRIKSVGPWSSTSVPGAEVIDLSRYTGIPGLIDVHTHLAGFAGDPGGPTHGLAQAPNQALLRPPVIDMFLAREAPQRMLEAGVTSVRDVGTYQMMDIAMRDLINRGTIPGPRMFVSGPIVRSSSALGVAVPEATADGPAEMTRVVRRLIAAGADHIKIMGTTAAGPSAPGATRTVAVYTGTYAMFTDDELRTAVEVAHGLGKRVAVHTIGQAGARSAVRAGANSIEHGIGLDDSTMAEMAKRGTILVPTLYNGVYTAERVRPQERAWFENLAAQHVETVRRAVKAGVTIAMGSDVCCITWMSGEHTRELAWFVKAGMTPAQALATATTNAAALLGKEKELGSVAPGYFADLVAVDGNPLADIDVVVSKVRWVMKGGAIVVDRTLPGRAVELRR